MSVESTSESAPRSFLSVKSGATRTPAVWVLNLDAEHELEAGSRYSPTRNIRAIIARERAQLIPQLLAPGEYLLREATSDGSQPTKLELVHLPETAEQVLAFASNDRAMSERVVDPVHARGLPGFAWSPTPRALAQLRSVGSTPHSTPDLGVLQTVNARPFAAKLRESFVGDSFGKHVASNLEQVLAQLAEPSPNGWLVRRTFGAAGRGRRRIAAGTPTQAEFDWLIASLRRGPLVIEPWVLITREFTRSGSVEANGDVLISRPCSQETTATGAWAHTVHTTNSEISNTVDDQLQAAFESAGRALASEGYSGPFGIDAFLHRTENGRDEVLNPLSEINARFTMDWAYSMKP